MLQASQASGKFASALTEKDRLEFIIKIYKGGLFSGLAMQWPPSIFYAITVSWGGLPVCLRDHWQRSHVHPALYRISTSQLLNWGTIAATTVLTILPVLVVFAFVQRWLLEGLLAGAVKG